MANVKIEVEVIKDEETKQKVINIVKDNIDDDNDNIENNIEDNMDDINIAMIALIF